MSDLPTKVLCKNKQEETRLVIVRGSYKCPLCQGNDRQAKYYEDHEIVKDDKS